MFLPSILIPGYNSSSKSIMLQLKFFFSKGVVKFEQRHVITNIFDNCLMVL